jgi:para-nitrobenzyl esterase
MAMPSAKGLFHRAAIQSGATLRSGSRDAANTTAENVLTQLDLGRGRFRDLQGLPLETLLAVQGRFGPFLDGKVVPSHPFDPTAPELSADVPVIVGTDLHDMSFTRQDYDLDQAGLMEQARTMFGDGADEVVAAYRAADPRTTPFKLLSRISTDRGMRRNAIQLAERKAALGGAPPYMYLLTFESVPFGGRYGSVHGTEMPLFYHNLDKWPIAGTSDAAQALASRMAGAYISFATTGTPTVPGLGEWPAYTPARRATMVFDTDTRVENAPDQSLLALNERYSVAPQPPRN